MIDDGGGSACSDAITLSDGARAFEVDAACSQDYGAAVLAPWVHELATFATLTAAGIWLIFQFTRVAKPSGGPGCARCEHDARVPVRVAAPRGVRSKQLRVID